MKYLAGIMLLGIATVSAMEGMDGGVMVHDPSVLYVQYLSMFASIGAAICAIYIVRLTRGSQSKAWLALALGALSLATSDTYSVITGKMGVVHHGLMAISSILIFIAVFLMLKGFKKLAGE